MFCWQHFHFFAGSTTGTDTLSIEGLFDGPPFYEYGLYYLSGDEDITGSTDITIHDSTSVPEPASMLLLGAGLVGLFGIGRKRLTKK